MDSRLGSKFDIRPNWQSWTNDRPRNYFQPCDWFTVTHTDSYIYNKQYNHGFQNLRFWISPSYFTQDSLPKSNIYGFWESWVLIILGFDNLFEALYAVNPTIDYLWVPEHYSEVYSVNLWFSDWGLKLTQSFPYFDLISRN